MKAQNERNDKIAGLIQTMLSIYSTVVGSEVLKDERLLDVLSRILKLTVDCGFFVQEYTRQGTFLGACMNSEREDLTHYFPPGKAITETVSSTDASIAKYQDTFEKLGNEFAGRITTQTAVMLANVSDTVNDISEPCSSNFKRVSWY